VFHLFIYSFFTDKKIDIVGDDLMEDCMVW